MRKTLTLLLAGALGLGAASTSQAVTWLGVLGNADCTGAADDIGLDAELYAFKIQSGGTGYTDLLADLTLKVGAPASLAGASITTPSAWQVPNNFRLAEQPADVAFIFVTYSDGTLSYNSGVASDTGGSLGFNVQMPIGVSWPAALGGAVNPEVVAGIPGLHFQWGVFPEIAGDGAVVGGMCHVAGLAADPATGGGLLAGYNVYRVPGAAPPSTMDFYNETISPTLDHDGDGGADSAFQYFAPLGAFDFDVVDAGDNDPTGDLIGATNPDGTAWTGDEAGVFQDDPGSLRGGRLESPAPVAGTTYWYAVQPVVGRADDNSIGISDLAGQSLASTGAWTAAGMNLVPAAAGDDSIDLDGDGTIEFFSPQADFGIGGFGLTHGSLPLLSAPVMGDFTAASIGGQVELSGDFQGGDVALQFTTAQELGNVLGFNVFRHHGDVRVPVNEDMVLASGGEGSVYRLVDELGQTSRRLRRGSFEYTVDVVYSDGTPTRTVGPFTVAIGEADGRGTPTRRQR